MVQLCSIEQAVDDVLARLPAHIHMGLPLGLVKPNHFVNALFQRIAQLPERQLTLYTALCLGRPSLVRGRSRLRLAPCEPRLWSIHFARRTTMTTTLTMIAHIHILSPFQFRGRFPPEPLHESTVHLSRTGRWPYVPSGTRPLITAHTSPARAIECRPAAADHTRNSRTLVPPQRHGCAGDRSGWTPRGGPDASTGSVLASPGGAGPRPWEADLEVRDRAVGMIRTGGRLMRPGRP